MFLNLRTKNKWRGYEKGTEEKAEREKGVSDCPHRW
jgi:hypothetical protein